MNRIIDIVVENGLEFLKGIDVTIYDEFIDADFYFNEEISLDNETILTET